MTRFDLTSEQYAFLQMMAHELRTPLNSVLATCEMLVDANYGELKPNQQRAIDRIHRNGNRLADMITTVMLYMQVVTNTLEVQSQSFSLPQLIAEVVDRHRRSAINPHIEWQTEIAPHVAQSMVGDSEYLAVVLDALLLNAVHYTTEGYIRIHLPDADSQQQTIKIEDSGIGVSTEDMQRIFQPFWRSVEAKALYPNGTGLGLLIVDALMHQFNGTFTFQSNLKQGSTATLVLPLGG